MVNGPVEAKPNGKVVANGNGFCEEIPKTRMVMSINLVDGLDNEAVDNWLKVKR